MAFYSNPKIVTDGLTLLLDAGSERCYPGSGTTADSLIGSHVGTLTNGVGFSSANGGTFVFDGTDDYIEVPYSTQLDPTVGITFEAWIYPTDLTTAAYQELYRKENANGRHLFSFQVNGTILSFGTHTSVNGYNELDASITPSGLENKWLHAVASYQSGYKAIYINGDLIDSDTSSTGTLTQATAAQIIGSNGGGNEFFEGNYASFKMYNRGLTTAEITQNFNAQRNRFGI
ncbi:LamG domain-containing protein [Candidatus Peregrinibacteria bacterium]|nr:LamG domain-containing protein [Candidatus Peregrinibacteria bacterium]